MNINGDGISLTTVNITEDFLPQTRLAIKWLDVYNFFGRDNGASQDKYESTIVIYNTETIINTIQTALEANRQASTTPYVLTMSGFASDEQIFGADIDHSGSLTVEVLHFGRRSKVRTISMHYLALTVILKSPSFVGSNTLPTLHLDTGKVINDSIRYVTKHVSFDNTISTADTARSDTGIFEGVFIFDDTDMRNFRTYVRSLRTNTFSLTSIPGITYPFGISRGTYSFNVNIVDWRDMGRKDFTFWNVRIKFMERRT